MATSAIELDVDGIGVRLSSPDKVYFEELGITKQQVAEYAMAVGPGLLAGLLRRPTTLERWPGGVREGMKLSTRQDNRGDALLYYR